MNWYSVYTEREFQTLSKGLTPSLQASPFAATLRGDFPWSSQGPASVGMAAVTHKKAPEKKHLLLFN